METGNRAELSSTTGKSSNYVIEIHQTLDGSTRERSGEALGNKTDETQLLLANEGCVHTIGQQLHVGDFPPLEQTANPRSTPASMEGSLMEQVKLPRQLSLDSASDILQHSFHGSHRRRRNLTDSNVSLLLERQQSFRHDMEHAAAETYLVTQLSFTLLRYLGVGYRWILKFAALGLYALFLLPGFIQVGCYYFFSKRVQRSIVFGDEPRNRLDLYVPENLDSPKPVVAFVTGGAWIIGYKAWGALLGQQLAERNVIVACIDYRNFPQGTISDMVKDVSEGISFICTNIADYGGDPNRIYLAGQSAGAHIAACTLVEQAKKEVGIVKAELTWRLCQLKGFFGISGGYNLLKLVDHFHKRGLYRSIFLSIMEGEDSLPWFSPELEVQRPNFDGAGSLLPPMYLFHGTADYSIPCDASTSFAESLLSAGIEAKTRLYPDKTHTDLFLQDPMRGGYDCLLSDILTVVHAGDAESEAVDAVAPLCRRLVPEFLLQLARKVSPF
eukprot:c27019_g1_i1 orf=460-1956(+)